jgi:hypothetical protein
MLTANHWTEHRILNGGVREKTEGAEGVYNPIGRTTISTNQNPQSSQGLNHQPKSTHGGTYEKKKKKKKKKEVFWGVLLFICSFLLLFLLLFFVVELSYKYFIKHEEV